MKKYLFDIHYLQALYYARFELSAPYSCAPELCPQVHKEGSCRYNIAFYLETTFDKKVYILYKQAFYINNRIFPNYENQLVFNLLMLLIFYTFQCWKYWRIWWYSSNALLKIFIFYNQTIYIPCIYYLKPVTCKCWRSVSRHQNAILMFSVDRSSIHLLIPFLCQSLKEQSHSEIYADKCATTLY